MCHIPLMLSTIIMKPVFYVHFLAFNYLSVRKYIHGVFNHMHDFNFLPIVLKHLPVVSFSLFRIFNFNSLMLNNRTFTINKGKEGDCNDTISIVAHCCFTTTTLRFNSPWEKFSLSLSLSFGDS